MKKKCREISEDKTAVCEKTAGLRSGNSSDLDSACLRVFVPVIIFQFKDMHNENRFLDTFRGHNTRPTVSGVASPTIQSRYAKFQVIIIIHFFTN